MVVSHVLLQMHDTDQRSKNSWKEHQRQTCYLRSGYHSLPWAWETEPTRTC